MLYFLAQLVSPHSLPKVGGSGGPGSDTLQTILDIIFTLVGAIAMLMVVIAGFRYIRAGSNDTIISESKRQLAHALVGVIVAASAVAIVNFVLDRVS
ncbi:MAG TPA: TrbC/VirB2 family protein [Candidatus Saccharimonadales bacterium]|nr:TrbC/VirB2 family protein [Candidatus Saccharimonadales bacterium]